MGWTLSRELEIASFVGKKPIIELKVYPLRFHLDYASLRDSLIERGRKRIRLYEQRFYEYSSTALYEIILPLGINNIKKISIRILWFLFVEECYTDGI